MSDTRTATAKPINSPAQVLFASLIGTTIEFFDFYIYATAAVLVFPQLFFPASDPASATLASLATFAHRLPRAADRLGAVRPLRRSRRPQDHAGRRAADDGRVDGRRSACCRPTRTIGIAAPLLLALCRFGQGLGLGGEWGGAVLLAIENAPPGKRAWYGMFPQLGAPVGFFFSGGVFLLLSRLAHRRAVLRLRLAPAVPRQRGAGARRPLRAADDHRDAGLPRGAQPRRARRRCRCSRCSATTPATLVLGIADVARDLRAVLPDDGVRAVVGHHRARLQPREVPADAAVRRSLFFALTIPISRAAGRARPPPHADRGSPSASACSAW